MSSESTTNLTFPRLEETAVAPDRLVKPSGNYGVLIDGERIDLNEIQELAGVLMQKSAGKIEQLRRTAEILENRLRNRAEDGRRRIREAFELAREAIDRRLAESERRAREAYDERLESARASGRDEGYREGFEKGYEEGLQKGLREGRERGEEAAHEEGRERIAEETAKLQRALEEVLAELDRNWRQTVEEAHRDLVRLAIAVAERIIRRRLSENPDLIRENLEEAIDRVAEGHRLKVEIHPEDRRVLADYLGELARRLDGSTALEIVESPGVGRGGCRVHRGDSFVDLSIDTQLDIVRRRLEKAWGGVS